VLDRFSDTVSTWHTFYTLAGTTSATLIGLLLVAISMHIEVIRESRVAATFARRAFTLFLTVVAVALLFEIPHLTPRGLGIPLLALGAAGLADTAWAARVLLGHLKKGTAVRDTAKRVVISVVAPVCASAGMVLVAATVVAGRTAYLGWLVPVVVLTLAHAAANAWDLILGLARAKLREADEDSSP
jgi:hypothetical protein